MQFFHWWWSSDGRQNCFESRSLLLNLGCNCLKPAVPLLAYFIFDLDLEGSWFLSNFLCKPSRLISTNDRKPVATRWYFQIVTASFVAVKQALENKTRLVLKIWNWYKIYLYPIVMGIFVKFERFVRLRCYKSNLPTSDNFVGKELWLTRSFKPHCLNLFILFPNWVLSFYARSHFTKNMFMFLQVIHRN